MYYHTHDSPAFLLGKDWTNEEEFLWFFLGEYCLDLMTEAQVALNVQYPYEQNNNDEDSDEEMEDEGYGSEEE